MAAQTLPPALAQQSKLSVAEDATLNGVPSSGFAEAGLTLREEASVWRRFNRLELIPRQAIEDPRQLQRAWYQLSVPDNAESSSSAIIPMPAGILLPETAWQQVTLLPKGIMQLHLHSAVSAMGQYPFTGLNDKHAVALRLEAIGEASAYLETGPVIEALEPSLSQEITGLVSSKKRSVEVALTLRDWVYKNLEKDADASVKPPFPSTSQIWQQKRGGSLSHAVLLASIARSVGLPARLVAGLLYIPPDYEGLLGGFVHHVWCEVLLDNPQPPASRLNARAQAEWLPLDAYFPTPWVDAAHIKLFHFDANAPDSVKQWRMRWQPFANDQLTLDVLESSSAKRTTLSNTNLLTSEMPGSVRPASLTVDLASSAALMATQQASQLANLRPHSKSVTEAVGQDFIHKGLLALTQGNWQEASRQWQQVFKEEVHPLRWYQLGSELAAVDAWPEAYKAFQRSVVSDATLAPLVEPWLQEVFGGKQPAAEQGNALLQVLALNHESPGGSEALLKASNLAARFPEWLPARLAYAQIQLESGATEEAVANYMQVAKDFPDNPEPLYYMGLMMKRLGKDDLAELAWRQAVSLASQLKSPRYQRMVRQCAQELALQSQVHSVEKQPQSVNAWLSLINGLQQFGRPIEAYEATRTALIKLPGNRHLKAKQLALEVAMQHWPQAEATYREVKDLPLPEAKKAAYSYMVAMRQYEAAKWYLPAMKQLATRDPQASLLLAERSLQKKEMAEAAVYLEKAQTLLLKQQTRDPVALTLAEYWLRLQRFDKARLMVNRYLEGDPFNALAYQLLGQIARREGKLEQAESHLLRAITLAPEMAQPYQALGKVALGRNDWPTAYNLFRLALLQDPTLEESARQVNLLIEKKGLYTQKANPYWNLTSDELAFLRQWLNSVAKNERDTRWLAEALASLKPSGEINVDGLIRLKLNTQDALRLFYQRAKLRYNEALELLEKPSPRLQELYLAHVFYLYTQLGFVREAIISLDLSDAIADKIKEQSQSKMEQAQSNWDAINERYQKLLSHSLPIAPADWESLSLQSDAPSVWQGEGLDGLKVIVIDGLKAANPPKKEPERPGAKKTAPAPSSALPATEKAQANEKSG